jgi:hypothetical protein
MTPDELQNKAHQLISGKLERHEIVQMPWVVQELIALQGEIMGDGVPWFMWCANQVVYRVVKNAVDKYDQPEQPTQLPLEGFDCLQKAYTVERDGDRQLVPIELLSDAELLLRADEFEKQAKTLLKHAGEIRQYVAKRASSVNPALN